MFGIRKGLRALRRRFGNAKRAKIGTVVMTRGWRWVSGNEFYNDTTHQWGRELRPGVFRIVKNEKA